MRGQDVLALTALIVAVGAFFGPALFSDQAVFPCNMDLWQPWKAVAGPDDLARPTRLADCARQFAVMRSLASDALQEGRIPLWNRWIYSGTPFLANFQPGVFYPPNLGLAVSGLSVADQMTAYLAFHLLLAVTGIYVLLRSLQLGAGASLLGAIVFGWSGYNAARTGIPTMVATGAWLPWAMAATRRWFRRGDGRSFAGMAGSLAMSGLAGFAQIFVFTVYAWGLFGLVESVARRRRTADRRWLGWAGAGVVGVLLVSVHLVPTLEFMGLAQDATNSVDMLASGTLHPWGLGKLVVPDLLGNPVDGNSATHLLGVGSGYYHQTERSTSIYLGMLPLLLAAVILAPGDHRKAAGIGLGLAALGLVWCFRTPLTNLAPWMPGLGFSRPDRAAFLWGFGAAIVAAVGAQRLAGSEGPGMRRATNRFALTIGAVALAFALLIGIFPDLLPASVVERVGRARLIAAAGLAAATAAVALTVIGLRATGRIGGTAFLAAAIALTGVDLGRFAGRINLMQPEESIYRDPTPGDVVDFLQQKREAEGPFRILRYEPRPSQFDGILPPSTAAPYGIEDALGFDSMNLAAYQEVMTALDPDIVVKRGNFRGVRRAPALASPLIDLLNVRWILAEGGGPFPGLVPVREGPVALHENPDALPRAFFVDEVRVIEDRETRIAALADPSFRPDLWAYAEGSITDLPIRPTGVARSPLGRAQIMMHGDERVVVAVAVERPALLVLTDAWYPGWRALVDGEERRIHRVDHAFRGVVVQPRDREVEFRYEPSSFARGGALSLVALAALVVASLALARGKRPRGGSSEEIAPA
jgi:hypothetical protein